MPNEELDLRLNEESGRSSSRSPGSSIASSPDLAVRLADLADGHARLIVDLAELKRIDSTGVAVILEAASASRSESRSSSGAPSRKSEGVQLTLARAEEFVDEAPEQFWDPVSATGEAVARMEQRFIESMQQFGEVAYWVHRSLPRSRCPARRHWRADPALRIERDPHRRTDCASYRALYGHAVGASAPAVRRGHLRRRPGGDRRLRGLGPFVTAIVVAGRSRSAVAAELGTMVVSEELDALRTMGLNPMRYLIVPRILAMTICVPILAAIANLIAIIGGMMIGVFHLGISVNAYYHQTLQAITLSDLVTGLVKSLVFGIVIGNVGVFEVSTCEAVPRVGRATTQSVVTAIFLIIVTDAIFTALFYFL